MSLNFPSSPIVGQEYTYGGFTWIWNGSSWDKVSAATSSGGGSNGFYLYMGTNGNTNFELVSTQKAGIYYITTFEKDVTYDIYAISPTGDLAGYTNTDRLITTSEFSKVVVIGGTTDDVLYFDTRDTAFTTSKTDINDGGPAFITATSVQELESFNDSTVITGGNFATDVEVYFVGINSTDYQAKSVVRNSSTELIAVRPDNLVPDYAPYDIKIINPGIPIPSTLPTQHILSNAITAGTYPLWVTTSPLFWERGETTNLTLVAADVENSDIDYELVGGTLWNGFSLNQETGVITGNDSALQPGDMMTITVRATDTAGNVGSSNSNTLVAYEKSFVIYADQVPVSSFYFDPFASAGNLERVLLPDMNLN